MDFLNIIRAKRVSMKLTQEYMGARLGVAKETYRNIENGHIRLKVDDFIRICNILHLSPSAVIAPDELNVSLSHEEIVDLRRALRVLERINADRSLIDQLRDENAGDLFLADSISNDKK